MAKPVQAPPQIIVDHDGAPAWSTSPRPSGLADVLKEHAERNGFTFLDLKPHFVSTAGATYRKSGELAWWRDDTHWNVLGQKQAAALIDEQMRRTGGKGGAPSRH